MEIIIAEHAGFCFGVKNAMKTTQDLIDKGETAFTLGPLIHNQQVIADLQRKGIVPSDLWEVDQGNLIIRTHGVAPQHIEWALEKGLNVIDATCPFVKKVHKIVREISKQGYFVIIIGDPNHPEVEGIKGWSAGDVKVIDTPKEANNFYTSKAVCIVVQTTQTEENVDKILEILNSKLDVRAFYNTRCDATSKRQQAAISVANKVDVMLVIGGKNSSNTNKLARVCQDVGVKVFHIETPMEIDKDWFKTSYKVGITAGASTPDWIIKEVILKMEEVNRDLNTEEVQEQEEGAISYADSIADIKEDAIVEGTVVKVDDSEVLVNIGYKSDGILPLNELSNVPFESPSEIVNNGDKINVYVLKLEDKEGNVLLSKKKADAINAWHHIEEAYEKQQDVEGVVTEVVKGGVLADVGGVIGFVPASHMDLRFVPDLNIYQGQQMKLRIIEVESDKRRVVLSRKLILEEERERMKEETWANLEEGQIIKGIVRRLTDFGAFVDIGGVDGLIHISDLAWHKVKHPRDIVEEDQEVEVLVLKLDRERERISLGLKQVMSNPWDDADKKYQVGSIIEGRVAKLVSFGAFVEVEPGIEGLVHISQIANEHINEPSDVLKAGDMVNVKILDVNVRDRRMSLSIKETLADYGKRNGKYDAQTFEMPKDDGVTIGDMVGDLFNKKED
jgi:small subunit ribosomal protein S1